MLSRLNQIILLGARPQNARCSINAMRYTSQTVSVQQRGFFGGGKPPPPLDFDPEVDYYKVLGLTKKSSDKDIKNAYYKGCYEYHPDRTGGMHQDKFKDINNAYQVLSDSDKKKQYDGLREEILSGKSSNAGAGDFRDKNSQW